MAPASCLRDMFIVASAPSSPSMMAAQARAAPKWSEAYFACLGSGMEGFQRGAGGGVRGVGGDQDNSDVQVQRACTLCLSQSTEANQHATL